MNIKISRNNRPSAKRRPLVCSDLLIEINGQRAALTRFELLLDAKSRIPLVRLEGFLSGLEIDVNAPQAEVK